MIIIIIPAAREPISLSRIDGERPNRATLIPLKRGKPIAWDVTVPDTYAASHLAETVESSGAEANKAAANKISKDSTFAMTQFRSHLHRNRRTLEPWIIRIHRWTRQENFPNYTRIIGNTIFCPKAVHIAAERKRTSIQKHVLSRIKFLPGSVPFHTTPNLQFLACRLRDGGCKKIKNNNSRNLNREKLCRNVWDKDCRVFTAIETVC